MKDSTSLQRYYNEHVRLPEIFFRDPQKFIESLSRGKRILVGIYNHVDREFASDALLKKYRAREINLLSMTMANKSGYIIYTPEATDEVLCKMIGVSLNKDGTNPVLRTIEIDANGEFKLCGWSEDHLHVCFRSGIRSEVDAIRFLRSSLEHGEAFTTVGYAATKLQAEKASKKLAC